MPKYRNNRNNKNISTMPLPSPRGTRGLSPGALPGIPKGFTRDIPPASFPRIPKNFDDAAFDAMTKATESDASNLFTESVYNTTSNNKERKAYDTKAHDILRRMYDADSAKNEFKNIDFDRYLELLKPSLFEERVLSREGDQKAGDLFLDVYEGDFDQFRASALNSIRRKSPKEREDDYPESFYEGGGDMGPF